MNKKLTKEQKEELQKIQEEILEEAKKVVEDYSKNPSKISGSVINIHQNSPALDTEKDSDEPLYSGSRWTHVLKTKI
jgi:vacuolar-type H+-ATPase subunit E/Vma4